MKLKKIILLGLAVALCTLALAACAGANDGQKVADTGSAETTAEVDFSTLNPDDPYISDEACLSCHGGTYAAVAERTASYGDSNPHDPVHGGYLTCDTCHSKGNEVPTEHYCTSCHDWPREEQSVLS